METQNLWPDFVIEPTKSPKSILKEQAGYLIAKTNNVLSAEIETAKGGRNDQIVHDFYIIAPAINNYRYRVFSVSHKIVGYYPVTVSWNDDDELWNNKSEAKNEGEFIDLLRTIFNVTSVTRVISSLLSQSLAE